MPVLVRSKYHKLNERPKPIKLRKDPSHINYAEMARLKNGKFIRRFDKEFEAMHKRERKKK